MPIQTYAIKWRDKKVAEITVEKNSDMQINNQMIRLFGRDTIYKIGLKNITLLRKPDSKKARALFQSISIKEKDVRALVQKPQKATTIKKKSKNKNDLMVSRLVKVFRIPKDKILYLKQMIESDDVTLENTRDTMRSVGLRREQNVLELRRIEAAPKNDVRELLHKQLERIALNPQIKKVNVNANGKLVFETVSIIGKPSDGGKTRLVFGRYIVSIILGATDYTRIENRDLPTGTDEAFCHHPHAPTGTPCWGEIGETIRELSLKRLLPELVSAILIYLGSWNSSEQTIDELEELGFKKAPPPTYSTVVSS